MDASEKQHRWFARIGLAFVVCWFIGDVGLTWSTHVMHQSKMKRDADRMRAASFDVLRNRAERYGGGQEGQLLPAMTSLRDLARVPLRIAGVVGLVIFFAYANVRVWLNKKESSFVPDPLMGGISRVGLFLAVLLFATSVVYGQSRTSMKAVDRVFSIEERRKDLELRTVRIPQSHPNHGTTTYGRERRGKTTMAQIDEKSRRRILVIRLFSGALAIIGFASLVMGSRPKRKEPTHHKRKLPDILEMPFSKEPSSEDGEPLGDA
ncbi:membrane protein [Rhodopirellula maiorica SM1]|uniref:Membrane protein n=1 Tax=Rhodopirellula maiorica SM1 TaxID=1265738 RepID=M5RDK5_9BACT|nr:hypothetical protein [Rhodopirellula maiorica]EMI17465.1 membrane protein [Rhodopirellula maiorica SM1]